MPFNSPRFINRITLHQYYLQQIRAEFDKIL